MILGTELSGTTVFFNGVAAPILYTSARQVTAITPYSITGGTVQVAVAYLRQATPVFTIPLAPTAPGLFTLNQTGAGQLAGINAIDGEPNTPANPVRIGEYISPYTTGEGQTIPAGVYGRLGGPSATTPVLPLSVTLGGLPATVQYAGSSPGQVAGLMQSTCKFPPGCRREDMCLYCRR